MTHGLVLYGILMTVVFEVDLLVSTDLKAVAQFSCDNSDSKWKNDQSTIIVINRKKKKKKNSK